MSGAGGGAGGATYEETTVLALGARGKTAGAAFTLAGRTCVKSAGGGLWNEWTLAFDDGRRAYLAEAMGGFTLFWERAIAPTWDALAVGGPLDTRFVVVERGEAKRVARWGDTPDAPRAYRYADLSSKDGEAATIDYGGAPDVFVGRRVRLAELGLAPRPDAGGVRFVPVKESARPKGLETWLGVGDVGDLATADKAEKADKGAKSGRGKASFRVIGILQRSIRIEGERYTWEEYVLHSPVEGLRWLVVSDGHWNLVATIEAGEVDETEETKAVYRGETYRYSSSGTAKIEWATGELPWELGDVRTASVADYVRAPNVLSRESTKDEVTWSLGTYTPPDVVARAFGKRVLPKPSGRAPNQPKASR